VVANQKNTTAAAETGILEPAAGETTIAEQASKETANVEPQQQPEATERNVCKGHRAIKGSWKQLFEFTTGISTRTDDNKYMLTLDEFDRVVGHHADCDGYANPSTRN
jgi:hypothetical protein